MTSEAGGVSFAGLDFGVHLQSNSRSVEAVACVLGTVAFLERSGAGITGCLSSSAAWFGVRYFSAILFQV